MLSEELIVDTIEAAHELQAAAFNLAMPVAKDEQLSADDLGKLREKLDGIDDISRRLHAGLLPHPARQKIKARLNHYRQLELERQQLLECIDNLDAATLHPHGQSLSGMPKGGGKRDPMVEAVARHIELRDKYVAKVKQMTAEQIAIEAMIEQLDSDTQRRLLRWRYICGLSWKQVSIKMSYAWAQTHRIHAQALKALAEKEADK